MLYFISIFFIFFLFKIIIFDVFAISPYFSEQEIVDDMNDWVDMSTNNITSTEELYTDILSVDYFSNGKTLNAILWLFFPFKEIPSMQEVDYGMLIDSDFDSNTGFGGIDYKVEIQWNNESKMWNKVVEGWSTLGEHRTIESINNYTNFYEKGLSYVTITTDLQKILYPQKYKVLFYSDFRKSDGTLISDYTRWIAVPPLELGISVIPSSIELSRDISKTIEVRINSTEGYAPRVNLTIENKPSETFFKFHFNELTLPSYGIATTPLTIMPTKDELLGPQTFYIIAKSSFPPEELITIEGIDPIPPANVMEWSVVSMIINPEPDIFDNIKVSWGKIGDFTQFLYGVVAGISPWIYQQIRKFWNKDNHNTN